MQSNKLLKAGLNHKIGGVDYDFRVQKVGPKIGDDIRRLMKEFDCPIEKVYSGSQTHKNQVVNPFEGLVEGEEFYEGVIFPETDGLITDRPGVGLLVKFADCTPVLLYDPVKKVQAVVHSGWRSTVLRISQVAIDKMQEDFSCRLSDILAYVGPSIDGDNYEVGQEVYEAFSGFKSRSNFFQPGNTEGKYQLDMKKANLAIIHEAGIEPDNIEVSDLSTYTDSRLHSARREGNQYGLNAMISVIEE